MFLVPQFAAGVPGIPGVPMTVPPEFAGDGQSRGTGNGGRP